MLALGDVEAAHREKFPASRMVREKRPGKRSRDNYEARPGFLHELRGAAFVQRQGKAVYPAAKIPDKTRFFKLDRAELHVRLQV